MPNCLLEDLIALFSRKAAKSQRKTLFYHYKVSPKRR